MQQLSVMQYTTNHKDIISNSELEMFFILIKTAAVVTYLAHGLNTVWCHASLKSLNVKYSIYIWMCWLYISIYNFTIK